jgi:hypothetical protein
MAAVIVVLGMRMLATPTAFRVLTYSAPAWVGGPGLASAMSRWDKYAGLDLPDEEVEALVSGPEAYPVTVASYTGAFELRKMVLQFTQADAAIATDDVRQCSIHLAKLSGGLPTADWLQADFDTCVAAVGTWWGGLASNWSAAVKLDRIKFYKAGPAIVPPQPPVYELDQDVVGTGGTFAMPPQVAISVTEKAGTKPHWGRFYLPAPEVDNGTAYGRITTTLLTQIADRTDTMYSALRSASLPPVVYRAPLPARFTRAAERAGATEPDLPAREASAWTVDQIQVDDVWDVVRRRRWKYPTLRVQRDIT